MKIVSVDKGKLTVCYLELRLVWQLAKRARGGNLPDDTSSKSRAVGGGLAGNLK